MASKLKTQEVILQSPNGLVEKTLTVGNDGKVSIGNISADELSYLDGVTSSIQTQLNSKETVVYQNQAVSKTIVSGKVGGYNTVTISCGGNDPNGDIIIEVQLVAYTKALDYLVARYSGQPHVVLRNNASNVSVAVNSGNGTDMTLTITSTGGVHYLVRATFTVGGLSYTFSTEPTITFS